MQQLTPILEKMGREIDNQEEKILTTGTTRLEASLSGKMEEEEDTDFNPELKLSKPSSQKLSRSSSLMSPMSKARKNISMQ